MLRMSAPAPGINRLVFVADGANVVAISGEHAHEFVLRTVRVLIFVDQQILETAVVVLAHLRRRFQQAHRFEQKIVEVEGVGLAQFLSVFLVEMRDLLGLGIGRLQVEFLRIEHVILRPRNAAQNGARRELLVVEAEPLHHAFDHRLLVALVVDDKVFRMTDRRLARNARRDAHRFDVAAQHAHAKRMEGRDDGLGDAQSADQFFDALAHFRGSLVGEGHRQDGFRHHALVLDQIGDAVGDDAGLAAARAGEDQHRAFSGFDGFALLRVQLVEKRQCGSGSRIDPSILQGNTSGRDCTP